MVYNILTTSEMKILDKKTCEQKSITSLELMRLTGHQLYQVFYEQCQPKPKQTIVIAAGVGNNGGDGLVMGLYLLAEYDVVFVIVGNVQHITSETKVLLEDLISKNAKIIYAKQQKSKCCDNIKQADFIIDAIFGIGLDRKVEGQSYEVIEMINNSKGYVFSIDIPSGINGNNGLVEGIAVEANYTAVVQNYKIGNILNDAKDYHGIYHRVEVGIIQKHNFSKRVLLSTKVDLPKRIHNSHKYHYGNVLTIGGNIGMTGAVLICAYAALRTGSGLSSIFTHDQHFHHFNNIYPKTMVKPYENNKSLLQMIEKFNVIAIGPGWGRNDDNYDLLKSLIQLKIPLVIDADGLYYFRDVLDSDLHLENIIITPHTNEMAMLLDINVNEVLKDPISAVLKLVNKNLTVVLKGVCTIIGDKDGLYFSSQGNPGMASAGSGDCLTGIIASLVGQKLPLIEAAKLGVIIHSQSANKASQKKSEASMIATDIIENIII